MGDKLSTVDRLRERASLVGTDAVIQVLLYEAADKIEQMLNTQGLMMRKIDFLNQELADVRNSLITESNEPEILVSSCAKPCWCEKCYESMMESEQ